MCCRIEELEKGQVQLNGERQRLQEDLEEVQERLTAGQSPLSASFVLELRAEAQSHWLQSLACPRDQRLLS